MGYEYLLKAFKLRKASIIFFGNVSAKCEILKRTNTFRWYWGCHQPQLTTTLRFVSIWHDLSQYNVCIYIERRWKKRITGNISIESFIQIHCWNSHIYWSWPCLVDFNIYIYLHHNPTILANASEFWFFIWLKHVIGVKNAIWFFLLAQSFSDILIQKNHKFFLYLT